MAALSREPRRKTHLGSCSLWSHGRVVREDLVAGEREELGTVGSSTLERLSGRSSLRLLGHADKIKVGITWTPHVEGCLSRIQLSLAASAPRTHLGFLTTCRSEHCTLSRAWRSLPGPASPTDSRYSRFPFKLCVLASSERPAYTQKRL